MPWRAVIVTLVLMGATAGVLVGFGVFEDSRNFRPEIRDVLEQLTSGEAEELYEEGTADAFRQTVLKDKFLAMSDQVRKTLGTFKNVGAISESDISDGQYGPTSRVSLELEFEHGRTSGELSFHRKTGSDKWLLLGISIVIPKDMVDKARALRTQYDQVNAPSDVLDKVTAILEQVRDGKAAAVHAGASAPFKKSVTGEAWLDKIDGEKNLIGSFVRVLAIISSAQNSDKNQAKVSALIEYDKPTASPDKNTRTTGHFGFVKAPAGARGRGGAPSDVPGDETGETQWQLSYYKIDPPPPELPSRAD